MIELATQGLTAIAKEREQLKSTFTITQDKTKEIQKIISFPTVYPFNGIKEEIEPKKELKTETLIFTKQEISKMALTFKKEFIANGLCAHIIQRKSGKTSNCYEIRYRKNGYDISASSTNLQLAKQKFLEKTVPGEIDKYYKKNDGKYNNVPKTFTAFAIYYFENKRKRLVSKITFENDYRRLKKHLIPYFKEKPLKNIILSDCQKLIDNILENGKGKTASEILSLMNLIFKYAKDNHIITFSPSDAVIFEGYQKKNGVAFTKQEEIILLDSFKNTPYQISFAIALYTGIRPNEYTSIVLDEKKQFIIAKNSKQKNKRNGEIVYKKIPVTPMLKPYIDKNTTFQMFEYKHLLKKLKQIFPNHTLYDLRTTFYSRCKECHVEEYALKEFMGHSLKAVDKAYTDLSDEYLLLESKKIKY